MAATLPPLSGLPGRRRRTPLSIAALRSAAARDPKAAIRETAKQFEALFMQQLMKSMREATLQLGHARQRGHASSAPRCSTASTRRKMTGLPGGLTDAIARQLERQMGGGAAAALGRAGGRRRARAPAAGGHELAAVARSRSTSCSSTQAPRAPPRRRAASRPRS